MDRVIPKDVIDIIYKESHIDKMKRLNAEYLYSFVVVIYLGGDGILKHRFKSFYFGYRSLNKDDFDFEDVCSLRNNKIACACKLSKRYLFSSGHSELKWIE